MVLVHVDHRILEGAEATGTFLISGGDMIVVIASHQEGLAQLALEDRLVQRSLDLFRDADTYQGNSGREGRYWKIGKDFN